MLLSNQKTSLQIPFQLPAYIRDDPNYANFVLFLQAYYEWLEKQDNVTDVSKNLLNYKDIDALEQANVSLHGTSSVVNQFIEYFQNDFLSNFPKEILANQTEVIKLAKQLYQSKGTPASYKFLFRILYNTDVDFFNTKDAVLKASAGSWYVPTNLNVVSVLQSQIHYWTKLAGLKIVGLTSKAIAVIENVVIAQNGQVAVYLSELDRNFQSGETVYIIDKNNQNVKDSDGNQFIGKIVGQLTQIAINSNYRGLYYQVGNPVVVYGGLLSQTSLPATAEVSSVSQGSIQSIVVNAGGYGYTSNTLINFANAPGAAANVYSLNPSNTSIANVNFLVTDSLLYVTSGAGPTIGNTTYSFFSNNSSSNANTSLANTFAFASFSTYPISSVILTAVGAGIINQPIITAESIYQTSNANTADLAAVGILAPIQIINPGLGYHANDKINIIGGSGYSAYANVLSVNANGAIATVGYVYKDNIIPRSYPLGGMGYQIDQLPIATITTSNTAPAKLSVPGILGTGATFYSSTNRAGAIQQISVTYGGADYVTTPNVSLSVQDILITGVLPISLPISGQTVYQGTTYATSTYRAQVDSVTPYNLTLNPLTSTYTMRVYNYTSQPSTTSTVKIFGSNTSFNIFSSSTSVTTYGDGTAKASATFLSGLNIGKGEYLNNAGQLSTYDVLQSNEYNDYTYEITLEKEIAVYKNILLNLLHPAGTQVLGRYKISSNGNFVINASDAIASGHTLNYYTGTYNSTANVQTNFTNQSNNIITFNNLYGANLATFIFSNSTISLTTANGFIVDSEVANVNYLSNTVILKDNVWLTFANVAYVTANAGSNVININKLTNSYDIINDGAYSNTAYPLKDIVYGGDKVQVNNQIAVVSSVDYVNGKIKLVSTLTYGVSNGFMSVNRTVNTNNVKINGPLGTQYFPIIITEDGRILLTEDGNILVLG
jgi:hypothetical protein